MPYRHYAYLTLYCAAFNDLCLSACSPLCLYGERLRGVPPYVTHTTPHATPRPLHRTRLHACHSLHYASSHWQTLYGAILLYLCPTTYLPCLPYMHCTSTRATYLSLQAWRFIASVYFFGPVPVPLCLLTLHYYRFVTVATTPFTAAPPPGYRTRYWRTVHTLLCVLRFAATFARVLVLR